MNRLLAISDIHGCFDTFHELLIHRVKLDKSDRLILLGDYIDRGSKSREVVDLIIDMQKKGFDLIPLAGNHEVMLIDTYRDNEMLPLWTMNSGQTTIDSFNIISLNDIEDKYINFFTGLKFYESVASYIFVHAGFNDTAEDPFKDNYNMIWETRASYSHPALSGKTIIHGHRPKKISVVKETIEAGSGVIPVDTGCVYTGHPGLGILSVLEINTMKLISLENIEKQ